jgi:putative zinc finger/helix-turn-helix YgiT family protein
MTAPTTLCPNCELEALVIREVRDVPLGQRRVSIDDERMRCPECDEEFYTPDQADRRQQLAVERARLEDGLLAPREIKSIRERLRLTQRQFELVLGVGEKTVVRWESGRVCPNKGIDRLIRLVAASRENLRMLAAINGVALGDAVSESDLYEAETFVVAGGGLLDPEHMIVVGGTAEEPPSLSTTAELRAVRGALQQLKVRPVTREALFIGGAPWRARDAI